MYHTLSECRGKTSIEARERSDFLLKSFARRLWRESELLAWMTEVDPEGRRTLISVPSSSLSSVDYRETQSTKT